ncbi:MAG: hypothetical protein AB2A00_24240 [Myxococcota bacterium]
MARNASKVVDMLLEHRLTDRDIQARNQGIKDRLDKIGLLLNAMKAKWNAVNTHAPITEPDYDVKDFT